MIVFFIKLHLLVCAFCVLVSIGAELLGKGKEREREVKEVYTKHTGRKVTWYRKVIGRIKNGVIFLLPIYNILAMVWVLIWNFGNDETVLKLIRGIKSESNSNN